MEKVTRTFKNCEDLFEAIIAAHKRHSNIQVYLPKEIPAAANEVLSEIEPAMETRRISGDLDNCVILNLRIPGQREIEFDLDSAPYGVYKFSVDFSRETDYCGMY